MGKIIEFPEVKNIKKEIKYLKELLNDLLLQKDNLILVICENIKTAYMLEIGPLEYKVYEAYCRYLRLRRKKDMIQSCLNSQKSINSELIDQQLDMEFYEYNELLKKKMEEISLSIQRSKMECLSNEEANELKRLYRRIVKQLHPDLNPKVSDEEIRLLNQANLAYKQGDLKTLKIIFQMVDSNEIEIEDYSSIKLLMIEKEKILKMVEELEKELDNIKSTAPYTWRIYLEDEEKKVEKKAELNKKIRSYQEAIRTQEEYINGLIRS